MLKLGKYERIYPLGKRRLSLRILCVCNLWPPHIVGGAEQCASALMESLAERGHSVSSVSIGPRDCAPREALNGVTVYRITPRNGFWFFNGRKRTVLGKALWHLRDAWNSEVGRELRRVIDEFGPEIIHTHNIDGISPIVWAVAEQQGIPTIHTAHDFHLLCPRTTLMRGDKSICTNPSLPCRAYAAWHRAMASKVGIFTAPSQFALDRHIEAGFRAGGFRVVRNGIAIDTADHGAGPRIGPLRLLFMGQIERHKGIFTMLEAMKLLGSRDDIILDVAGRGSLEEMIVTAAMADQRIRFHSFVQDEKKRELLRANHVLLVPSLWYENAPISIIEANLSRMAVIASRIGGLPEVVHHEKTGLLVPPGDAQALSDAISSLADGTVGLEKLRDAAKALSPYFSTTRMTNEFTSLYESLLGSR